MNDVVIDEVYTSVGNSDDASINSIGGYYTNSVGLYIIDKFMIEYVNVCSSTRKTYNPLLSDMMNNESMDGCH